MIFILCFEAQQSTFKLKGANKHVDGVWFLMFQC
jgi:hypothetical protein